MAGKYANLLFAFHEGARSVLGAIPRSRLSTCSSIDGPCHVSGLLAASFDVMVDDNKTRENTTISESRSSPRSNPTVGSIAGVTFLQHGPTVLSI